MIIGLAYRDGEGLLERAVADLEQVLAFAVFQAGPVVLIPVIAAGIFIVDLEIAVTAVIRQILYGPIGIRCNGGDIPLPYSLSSKKETQ